MNTDSAFVAAVETLLKREIERVSELSFTEIEALPSANSIEVTIEHCHCSLCSFMQRTSATECLVVVQVSKPNHLGLSSRHWEHGVIFAKDGATRVATPQELLATGG